MQCHLMLITKTLVDCNGVLSPGGLRVKSSYRRLLHVLLLGCQLLLQQLQLPLLVLDRMLNMSGRGRPRCGRSLSWRRCLLSRLCVLLLLLLPASCRVHWPRLPLWGGGGGPWRFPLRLLGGCRGLGLGFRLRRSVLLAP